MVNRYLLISVSLDIKSYNDFKRIMVHLFLRVALVIGEGMQDSLRLTKLFEKIILY